MDEQMKEYIGTKGLMAKPMNKEDYNALRGWPMPEGEDPKEEGYLVEYLDGGKPNHPDYGGYISWSPKDVFEAAYQPITAMSYGHAQLMAMSGKKIARAGWNGKSQFVAYGHGTKNLPAEKFWIPANREFAEQNGGSADVLPYFTMKNAQGQILMGWTPTASDALANDWMVVP